MTVELKGFENLMRKRGMLATKPAKSGEILNLNQNFLIKISDCNYYPLENSEID